MMMMIRIACSSKNYCMFDTFLMISFLFGAILFPFADAAIRCGVNIDLIP